MVADSIGNLVLLSNTLPFKENELCEKDSVADKINNSV
jgi:hypothetical protein